ncbi:LytTR family DNA-binding domain-containing protein [Litorivita sp. NS0012-18]|uniref:LytTR family DNA-binding domain-containing protein n=1 Tax=Litorivita sp. NS0012-18 TaxID=3127655 RepID=UPI003342BCC3
MKSFRSEFLGHVRSRLTLAIWLGLSFLAALTGPFGTFLAMGPARRSVYWFTVIGVAILIAITIRALAQRWLGPQRRNLRDLAVVCGNLFIFAPLLVNFNHALFPDATPPLMNWRNLVVYVLVISLAVVVMRRMHENRAFRQNESGSVSLGDARRFAVDQASDSLVGVPSAVPVRAPSALPRLAERLPKGEDLGGILRLTVKDHFVDVVGRSGRERLRMRFADAIKEMEPVEGYCIHRSHWVAAGAIDSVRREGGKVYLCLTNGDEVPVSRKYRPDLEAAGVL